jgi:hypothetical protein
MDTNEPAANWVVTTVTSATPTGAQIELSQGVGLAYDKAGLPVISFIERSNRQIWIAYDPPLLTAPTAPVEGDFNGDGFVDAGDLESWTLGMSEGGSAGDADADGDTDGADFLAWQRQLGSQPTSSSAAASVPEPATFALLCSGAFATLRRRRQG